MRLETNWPPLFLYNNTAHDCVLRGSVVTNTADTENFRPNELGECWKISKLEEKIEEMNQRLVEVELLRPHPNNQFVALCRRIEISLSEYSPRKGK